MQTSTSFNLLSSLCLFILSLLHSLHFNHFVSVILLCFNTISPSFVSTITLLHHIFDLLHVCVAVLPCLTLGTCKSARNAPPPLPSTHIYIPTTHREKEKKMGEGWSHSHLSLRQRGRRGGTCKE